MIVDRPVIIYQGKNGKHSYSQLAEFLSGYVELCRPSEHTFGRMQTGASGRSAVHHTGYNAPSDNNTFSQFMQTFMSAPGKNMLM